MWLRKKRTTGRDRVLEGCGRVMAHGERCGDGAWCAPCRGLADRHGVDLPRGAPEVLELGGVSEVDLEYQTFVTATGPAMLESPGPQA